MNRDASSLASEREKSDDRVSKTQSLMVASIGAVHCALRVVSLLLAELNDRRLS
jgi:hypothetical protein